MSYTQPISGNQFFKTVGNTVVTPVTVANATTGHIIPTLLQGTVNPTVGSTNYAIINSMNNTLSLPTGSIITSIVITGNLTSAGASIITFGLSQLNGGAIATSFASGIDINGTTPFANGLSLVLTGSGPTNATNTFISLTTGVTAPTGGPLSFLITYYIKT